MVTRCQPATTATRPSAAAPSRCRRGPEPLCCSRSETALIIVDMQNAYASPGGYLDLAGFDISGAAAGDRQDRRGVLDAARAAGMPVIFFQNGWDTDYVEAGGPGSPNWHKSNALKTMRAQAGAAGQAAGQGRAGTTSWCRRCRRSPATSSSPSRATAPSSTPTSTACCAPAASASLVFTGIATNVCVESTLRDGFFLEYFGVVLEDATHHAGPDFMQQASLYNIEKFFGWVSTVADFCGAIGQAAPIRCQR